MNFADIGKFQAFQAIKHCESSALSEIQRSAELNKRLHRTVSEFGKIDIRDCLSFYSGKNFAVCTAV